MVSFTFLATDPRPMTDNFVEGVRIGQKPAFNVRIGAGRDQPLADTALRSIFDFGLLLDGCGTVSINGRDNQLGWVLQHPLLDHSEIGTKLVQRMAMTSASRADPDSRFDFLLLHYPSNESPDECLMGSVFDEEVHHQLVIHR